MLLTSIDREGTWTGFDVAIVTSAVSIPSSFMAIIAHGDAGIVADIEAAVKNEGASAVALGSMVVYQATGMGMLVHFPDHDTLEGSRHSRVAA